MCCLLCNHRCHLVSLTDGAVVDASVSFAGRTAAADAPGHTTLLGPAVVNLKSGVTAVGWWGPTVLAVSDVGGNVSLAKLPGGVNILGTTPVKFNPGGGFGHKQSAAL